MARYIDLENPMVYLGGYTPDGHSVYHVPSNTPTADVVEVVRCKDCKHRVFEDGSYVCDLDTWDFHELGRNAEDDNWFCADGEKRERITGKAGEKEKTEYEEQQGKSRSEEGSGDPEA